MEVVELELDFGENFGSSAKLEEAVCNHGFFMMAPNDWNPLTKTLPRPLRLDDSSTSAIVSVSHDGANPNSLRVCIHPIHHHRPISSSDCQAVLVPVDSETMRHLRQVRGIEIHKKKTDKAIVEQIYDKYAPFQCLAYWFELVEYYESKFGKLSELPRSSYSKITGYLGNKQNVKNNND
ncbi:hypothetical protein LguiB_020343 [Lonicera macranthoides]